MLEAIIVALVVVVVDGPVRARWPNVGEAAFVALAGLFVAHLLRVMWP